MRWDKRGIGISTIIAIVITSAVFFFMLGFYNYVSAEVNDDVSEQLCRTTNALRIGTAISTIGGEVRLAPRGCKTIDKTVPDAKHVNNVLIPADAQDRNKNKYAAIQHVADLSARCWRMWLEGITWTGKDGSVKKDILDPESGFSPTKKCFICYEFELKKDVSFTTAELINYMDKTFHSVKDTSDQCSIVGGICKTDCGVADSRYSANVFRNEVPGTCNQIRPGTKCCVIDKKYDCENRGGKCSPGGVFQNPFNGWKCRDSSSTLCFLSNENYFSYTKYIQEFNGRGRFHPEVAGGFKPNEKYSIVFNERVKPWTGITFPWTDTEETQIDGILIRPQNAVGQNCEIDWGVAEK